jgi:hypothetical protein
MEPSVHLQSHVGADGTLHIEGLHQMANQDVTVILAPQLSGKATPAFDLEQYRAANSGQAVVDRLNALSQTCAALPVLDSRTPDEMLGYDDIGLPS